MGEVHLKANINGNRRIRRGVYGEISNGNYSENFNTRAHIMNHLWNIYLSEDHLTNDWDIFAIQLQKLEVLIFRWKRNYQFTWRDPQIDPGGCEPSAQRNYMYSYQCTANFCSAFRIVSISITCNEFALIEDIKTCLLSYLFL